MLSFHVYLHCTCYTIRQALPRCILMTMLIVLLANMIMYVLLLESIPHLSIIMFIINLFNIKHYYCALSPCPSHTSRGSQMSSFCYYFYGMCFIMPPVTYLWHLFETTKFSTIDLRVGTKLS